MNFKEFCYKTDLLEDFDTTINTKIILDESQLGDLDFANVISKELENISLPNIKTIMGVIAVIAKTIGLKLKDIIMILSKEGIKKIKEYITNDIFNSEEVKNLIRGFDQNRYKGYRGFEQYVQDMKEENPSIVDNITKIIKKMI